MSFERTHNRQIGALVTELGGVSECKRLGFIQEDEKGVVHLSTAGLGYLLSIKTRDATNVAEAFAAGREFGIEEKTKFKAF